MDPLDEAEIKAAADVFEALRAEIRELRTSLIDVCDLYVSQRSDHREVRAIRQAANDTSAPFSDARCAAALAAGGRIVWLTDTERAVLCYLLDVVGDSVGEPLKDIESDIGISSELGYQTLLDLRVLISKASQ